jgi:hypothetical protein
MLSAERERITEDFAWLKARTEHLARAEAFLDQVFTALQL